MKERNTATMLKTKSDINVLRQNPTLFQVNTRVWLTELTRKLGRQATLDDIPDSFFDKISEQGFTWVYFLSVWQTGEVGRRISRDHPGWKDGFRQDIPDLTDDDICGSGFAITDYQLNKSFGEPDALTRLHERVNKRGLKLMLDLVPNHTAVDHWWVKKHPEYYVGGDEEALARAPQNYIKVGGSDRIFAHGRDPYFDGWPDTLQLNYGNPDFQKAMLEELKRIAATCDGLRCDMAMLILPEIFKNTWWIDMEPFWPNAIDAIRKAHPDFVFMAEVYWDREWELQQQGFDFTYDKKLYDRLRQGDARLVREHFWADIEYQKHSARFLENHDEPRAAGTFSFDQHKAAAVLTFLSPGLRFLHQGQFEGFRKRVSVHLNRRPDEKVDTQVEKFYESLLQCVQLPVVHEGNWRLLECSPAWGGNWTNDCFVSFLWSADSGKQLIVVVNYAGNQSQCYVKFEPSAESKKAGFKLHLGEGPEKIEVQQDGVFVDLAPWSYMIFGDV